MRHQHFCFIPPCVCILYERNFSYVFHTVFIHYTYNNMLLFFFCVFREAEQKKSTKLNQNENLYIFANEFSVILFAILPRRRRCCCVDIVYIWRYTIQVYRIFSLILLNCYLINTFICLSDTDKQIIYKQKIKIDKWNILCEAYIVHTMLSLTKIKSIRLIFFLSKSENFY